MPVPPSLCNRLRAGSVADCVCRLPHELGWLECPPDALGLLEPVPAPITPSRGELLTLAAASESVDSVFEAAAARLSGDALVSVSRSNPAQTARLSGDICDFCGSPNLQWAGTCKVCRDCGSSAGGCS